MVKSCLQDPEKPIQETLITPYRICSICVQCHPTKLRGRAGWAGWCWYLVRCNPVSNPMQIECNIMSGAACRCWRNFPNLVADMMMTMRIALVVLWWWWRWGQEGSSIVRSPCGVEVLHGQRAAECIVVHTIHHWHHHLHHLKND